MCGTRPPNPTPEPAASRWAIAVLHRAAHGRYIMATRCVNEVSFLRQQRVCVAVTPCRVGKQGAFSGTTDWLKYYKWQFKWRISVFIIFCFFFFTSLPWLGSSRVIWPVMISCYLLRWANTVKHDLFSPNARETARRKSVLCVFHTFVCFQTQHLKHNASLFSSLYLNENFAKIGTCSVMVRKAMTHLLKNLLPLLDFTCILHYWAPVVETMEYMQQYSSL